MRGALISFSAGLCLATAIPALPAAASGTQTIVQEKAAAIGIVRTKARKYTASLAQGRLFHAYLSASTQSEGDRLKGRILASLKGLQNRYGLNDFTVIGRDGEVFAHIGSQPAATEKRNVKKDPILVAGFAQEAHTVSTLMDDDAVTYIAPVVLNGEREFVISIEQDLSAYEKVLALGLGRSLYVVIIDPAGNVVSDSNGSGAAGKRPSSPASPSTNCASRSAPAAPKAPASCRRTANSSMSASRRSMTGPSLQSNRHRRTRPASGTEIAHVNEIEDHGRLCHVHRTAGRRRHGRAVARNGRHVATAVL